MCYVFFSLHTACGHRQYQNTFRCSIARGVESHLESYLEAPILLPDTANPSPDPLDGDEIGPCQKRYPLRPVGGYCNDCRGENLQRHAFGHGNPFIAREERKFRPFLPLNMDAGAAAG